MVLVDFKLSLTVLHEIINNSENPKVALQLIEGTYKEPEMPTRGLRIKDKEILSFVSYDKWTNKVTFTHNRYRWYNEERKDWNSSQSETYCHKEHVGTGSDTLLLEEWRAACDEYLLQLLKEAPVSVLVPAIEDTTAATLGRD